MNMKNDLRGACPTKPRRSPFPSRKRRFGGENPGALVKKIGNRRRTSHKPPVFTVVPANPGFDPEAFARASYDVPTVDQYRTVVWMDRPLPLALGDIEREPGVERPTPVYKLNGAIGQTAPRDGGYRIDQLPKLIRGVSHHQPGDIRWKASCGITR